jgi:hypothetical protein
MHPLTASCKPDDSPSGIEILPADDLSKQSFDVSPILPDTQKLRSLLAASTKVSERVLPPSSDPSYNMFESASNGRTKNYLYLSESIERGQSVELRFVPGTSFAPEWMESVDNFKARNWIRDRIGALSLKGLRALREFLAEEIASPIYRPGEDTAVSPRLTTPTDSTPSALSGWALARKRVQWIANLVNKQLLNHPGHSESHGVSRSLEHYFDSLRWNKGLPRYLSIESASTSFELSMVTEEIEQEISNYFYFEGFNGFAGTRVCWCPLAEKLFRRIAKLFAELSVSFEEFSSRDEDDFLEKVCKVVLEVIEDLKQYTSIDSNVALEELVLTFKEGVSHQSNAFPSFKEVALSSYTQQYSDAMNLVGEMQIELPPRIEYQVVAAIAQTSDPIGTRFLNLLDIRSGTIAVDLRWYLERQVLAVVQCALQSGKASFPLPLAKDYEALDQIESNVLEAARSAMADPHIVFFGLESTTNYSEPVKQILLPESLDIAHNRSNYQPHSSPFFLGFIWPILRASGWRLSAGESRLDVAYFPPDSGRKKTHAGRLKKELTRETSQLAKDTASLGLGYIPKLTKRLIIKCVRQEQDDHGELQAPDLFAISKRTCVANVSSALRAYEGFLQESLRSDDKVREGLLRQKAKDVVKGISSLFEEVAPLTLFAEERCNRVEGEQWSDILGCEHLMRLLILLPTILKEADLPFRDHDQTILIVRELIDFLARNHTEHFASSFHLPKEEYEDESSVLSNLAVRITKVFPPEGDGANGTLGDLVDEESNEVILQGDRSNLTDFVAGVMSQVVIFRAKQEDLNRKGRRIPLGHPGLVCRHCLGQNGEGKYFFGSIESMTTASTVIEKHLLRCPHVPDSTRVAIVASRARHSDQRKGLKAGVQGAFFAGLFDRLRSMRISDDREGDESNLLFVSKPSAASFKHSAHAVLGASSTSDLDVNICDISDGFKSHLDVMDFIQSAEPWKSMDSLCEMVEKYYNCLQYGGKIYHTATMPSHFSSEWLYAKVGPRK